MDNTLNSKIRASQIENKKTRKLKILQTVRTFVHAHLCTDVNCKQTECDEMKALLVHFKECTRHSRKECPPCLQVLALTRYHAKHDRDCESNYCAIQFCARMKCILKQKEGKNDEDADLVTEDEEEVETDEAFVQTEQNFEPLPSTSAQFFACPRHPHTMTSSYLLTNEMHNQETFANLSVISSSVFSSHLQPYQSDAQEDFHHRPKPWQCLMNPNARLNALKSLGEIFKVAESCIDKAWIVRLEESIYRQAKSEQEYHSFIAEIFTDVVINKRF